jgi:dipeptidyl aminopeptidase/acylaminoacyl peptidase
MTIFIAIIALHASLREISQGEIAFMRDGCVWVLDVETGAERNVAEAQYDRPVTWSPDGKHLIWWDHRSGGWDLWRCEADGSNPINLTPETAGGCRSPSYSPDGSRVAFMRDDPNGLSVMNADGSEMRRLSERGHRDIPPQWSPDGTRLLYVDLEESGSDRVTMRLRLYDLETGEDHALAAGESAQWIDDARIVLAWHHESNDIIDVAALSDDEGAIKSRTSIARGRNPVVAPDRRKIAILNPATRAGNEFFELRIVDTAGESGLPGELMVLESMPHMHWSSDSRHLLLALEDSLRIIDTASVMTVSQFTGNHEFPVWRPTGIEVPDSQ